MYRNIRKLLAGATSTAVMAGMVTAGAVVGSVATAAPAAADPVTIGTVDAQMAGHHGKNNGTNGNCIHFDPPDNANNPPTSTTWVVNPTEAAASHGNPTSGTYNGQCPPTLLKIQPGGQSAIGITPTSETTADTDAAFLLGTMKHYNNPITTNESTPAHFLGNLNIRFKGTTFTFPYDLFETPNSCDNDDKPDPQQADCSDDILSFTGTPTGEITINVDGVDYLFSLVSSGFTAPTAGTGTCPVDPVPPAKTKFITQEGKITTGCLYGKLAQKRSINLVKKVQWDSVTAPNSIPNFAFTSTSTLVGSPWATNPGNLTPANSNGATAETGAKDFRAGVETVTITEGSDPANWQLSDLRCVDGEGAAVTGVSYSGHTVTLANVPDATSHDAVPITCTFTNTYTRSPLTLVKNWGANAVTGDKADLKILGGITSPATVTSTAPTNGTQVSTDASWGAAIQVSETFAGANVNTYTPTLQCVKTGTTDEVAGSSDGTFVMPKYPVTCTYTNVGKALNPGIHVVKTVDKTQIHSDDTVKYTFTVTNTGDTTLSNISVTDPKCTPVYESGDANSDNKLQTTETWVYTCSKKLADTTTNTVVAKGKDDLGKEVSDDDSVTVTVLKPGIHVVKTADKTEVKVGGSVTYTYTVTNTGDTALSNVSVTDNKCSPVSYVSGDTNTDSLLQTTETWTFECTTTLTETTENTAVAKGKDELGKEVTDEDVITVTVHKPGIKVVKAADKTEVKAGGSVTYTYTVTNTGDTPLLKVKVTDDKCAPVTYKSGDTDENEILGLEETWTFTCTTTLTETTTNTAVATGEDRTGQEVKDDDTAKVVVPKPGIKVVKTADKTTVEIGGSVTYTYTVTNTGDIELLNVTVTDDKCAPVTYKSGDTNSDGKLQVDETWTFQCTATLTETTKNTAVVTGKDRTEQTVTDQTDLTVTATEVKPIAAKRICPIEPTLVKKIKVKKNGDRVLIKKIKTNKANCVLLKPVVLCQPLGSAAAGETAFCDTKVTKRGRVTVSVKGYDKVRVKVIVRAKPKPGHEDLWKPNTWRKSWILKG